MFNTDYSRVAAAALGAIFFASVFVGAAVGPAAAFESGGPILAQAQSGATANG